MDMLDNDKHDAIGELFRLKLENHRLPVDTTGWNKIERRLSKRNKTVIWLWRSGAMAAAAAIALLLIIVKPENQKTDVMIVSQETVNKEPATTNNETNTIVTEHETITTSQPDILKPTNNIALLGQEKTENRAYIDSVDVMVKDEIFIAVTENDKETQPKYNTSEIVQPVKETRKSDNFLFADISAKKRKKLLLAADFSTNSNNSKNFDNGALAYPQLPNNASTRGSFNNDYAVSLSHNIKPLNGMDINDFTKIRHFPPLSFGITVRNVDEFGGVGIGLLYTYLSSSFEWSEAAANYNVNQNLHYVGIPVSMMIYLWNSNPNWQIYISGGVTVEKGIRAMYNQEMQTKNQARTTNIKKSFIHGAQLSLNSSLGVSYKLEKGWGIYFEPRVGYYFDCNQPICIRTESPLNVGLNIGLNYEIKTK